MKEVREAKAIWVIGVERLDEMREDRLELKGRDKTRGDRTKDGKGRATPRTPLRTKLS